MGFFGPLVAILIVNTITSSITKLDFGKSLVISFVSAFFCVFVTALFTSSLKAGLLTCLILFALAGIYTLVSFKKTRKKNLRQAPLPFSLFLFVIVYIFLYLFDLHRSFSSYDEFSHWGLMVEEM